VEERDYAGRTGREARGPTPISHLRAVISRTVDDDVATMSDDLW
jgi:hypothetical protein